MDESDISYMDGCFDFAVRELSGGWVVKYLQGWDDKGSDTYSEIIFTDEKSLTSWLLVRLTALKVHRNKVNVEDKSLTSYINFDKS